MSSKQIKYLIRYKIFLRKGIVRTAAVAIDYWQNNAMQACISVLCSKGIQICCLMTFLPTFLKKFCSQLKFRSDSCPCRVLSFSVVYS